MRSYCILLVTALLAAAGCTGETGKDTIFQTSTIYALMEGAYDGDVTIAQLRQHGDLGIGTFNSLDGEMIMLDGEVYQAVSDGTIKKCGSDPGAPGLTPFASVTFFEPDKSAMLIGRLDFKYVTAFVESMMPTKNLPCAVRITGQFSYVRTRAVPRQSRPYPRLPEVTKTQPEFELKNVTGTIVGFYLPAYVGGINVPGWHLHFITDDRLAGGHLLEFEASTLNIETDMCDSVFLALPTTGDFATTDLSRQNAEELEKVEK